MLVAPALACSNAAAGDAGGDNGKGGSCGEGSAGASSGRPLVPNASCPDFVPCGGELDGTWDVREACVTREQAVTAPIVGATQIAHVEDAVKATSLELSKEELEALARPYVPHPVLGHS